MSFWFSESTMVVSKNNCLMKGGKKKEVDPFSKTEWHDGSLAWLAYGSSYIIKNIGKSEVTRTRGSNTASGGLEGRVFKVSFAELQNDKVAFRKLKVITEDVHSQKLSDYFHGMALTLDKMHSMVKKCRPWLKLILMSEPLMVTCFICFVLVSLKPEITRCYKSPTRSITRSTRSGKRWKSHPEKCRQMTWREWLANCFQTTWGKIPKSLAIPFICFTLSVLEKEKCPRNPSLNEKTHGAPWWRFWKDYWWWDCCKRWMSWCKIQAFNRDK